MLLPKLPLLMSPQVCALPCLLRRRRNSARRREELFLAVSDLKFISTRCPRSAAVDGSQSGLMEPNWFHWDRPPAQEWPQRCPDGTTEFQLFRLILSYQMSRWPKMSIVPVKCLRQKQLRRISNPPQLSCVLTVVCRNLSG